jgi:hypothetical protein
MRRLRNLLYGLLAIALVACGEPAPTTLDRPTGADELVVRVETLGGLLPPLERERQLPEISIYGDGLVIVPAPQRDIFPGPAGYDLDSFRIEADLLDDIVAEAVAIGLHGPDRSLEQEGPDFVADAGATVVTVVTDGSSHVTSADALFDESTGRERQLLSEFVGNLHQLRSAADEVAVVESSRLRVYVAAPEPGFGGELDVADEVVWPFAEPLASWGEPIPPDGLSVDVRCRVVEGDQLEAVLPVLRSASAATIVVEGDDRRILAYRPVLPDEDGC